MNVSILASDCFRILNEFKTAYGVSTTQEEGIEGSAPVPPETPEQSSEVFSNKNKNFR
ncbi:MAG: hypothetical protein U0457_13360 [Candidatus Sericytochromatia bacterium]